MMALTNILVIDDEPNIRRSLELILKEAGYQVGTAENALLGLNRIKTGQYDLVFLDLKLPDKNGMEILPEIRQLYPDLPVLILTAHATLDSAVEAVRRGARDYLLKPIKPAHLLERIQEILAEQTQPKRRQEIVSQIQDLLAELRQVDGTSSLSTPIISAMPSTDPKRILKSGRLTLDLHTRDVILGDQVIRLPPSTFDYLVTLVRYSPNPVPYETLVMESQGYKVNRAEAREMARWQIHELRKALETDSERPDIIVTVRNVGYRLVV